MREFGVVRRVAVLPLGVVVVRARWGRGRLARGMRLAPRVRVAPRARVRAPRARVRAPRGRVARARVPAQVAMRAWLVRVLRRTRRWAAWFVLLQCSSQMRPL